MIKCSERELHALHISWDVCIRDKSVCTTSCYIVAQTICNQCKVYEVFFPIPIFIKSVSFSTEHVKMRSALLQLVESEIIFRNIN